MIVFYDSNVLVKTKNKIREFHVIKSGNPDSCCACTKGTIFVLYEYSGAQLPDFVNTDIFVAEGLKSGHNYEP